MGERSNNDNNIFSILCQFFEETSSVLVELNLFNKPSKEFLDGLWKDILVNRTGQLERLICGTIRGHDRGGQATEALFEPFMDVLRRVRIQAFLSHESAHDGIREDPNEGFKVMVDLVGESWDARRTTSNRLKLCDGHELDSPLGN